MQSTRIPATIISGFLGAGKTTLLRSLMEQSSHKKIAIIVNEFGSLGIDGDILKNCGVPGCTEENIVELANGCICCTVADEFLPTMEALLDRKDPPEHIIIETSGLALPKPLIKAFNWPSIKTRMTVDGVVTLVDSPAVLAGQFADDPDAVAQQRAADQSLDHDNPLHEVFEDQLCSADLVILNKIDLVTPEQAEQLTKDIQKELPRAVKIIQVANGKVDPEIILGINASAEEDLQSRPSHHDGEGEDHEHDDFTSFVVTLPTSDSPEKLVEKLILLAGRYNILRVKGYVNIANKPMCLEIHGVGQRFNYHFDRAWRADESRESKLIIIGDKRIDIEQDEIQAILQRDFSFFKYTMPKLRPADFYLGCFEGAVFIDFDCSKEGLISLCRISFDGHGCCSIEGNKNYLDFELSNKFLEEMKKDSLNQEIITNIVLKLIEINKKDIGEEVLKQYNFI